MDDIFFSLYFSSFKLIHAFLYIVSCYDLVYLLPKTDQQWYRYFLQLSVDQQQ